MKIESKEKTAKLLKIGPALATEMLRASNGNRKIRKWYVDSLARIMQRGQFRTTAEGIGFTADGFLIEGHHRLNAIIQSGETVEIWCMFGLDHDIYSYHNLGVKRSTADLHGLNKQTAEAINLAVNIAFGNGSMRETDLVHAVAHGTELFDALESLREFCPTNTAYFTAAPMRLAAAIHLMQTGDNGYVIDQWRALALSDIAKMSAVSQSLLKQTIQGAVDKTNSNDALVRGYKVFDSKRQKMTRIIVGEQDTQAARSWVRDAVKRMIDAQTARG